MAVGELPPRHKVPLCHHHRGQRPQTRDAETGTIFVITQLDQEFIIYLISAPGHP